MYLFPPTVVIEPITGGLSKATEGQVFSSDDLEQASPIEVTLLSGVVVDVVRVGDVGLTEAFKAPLPSLVWRSGDIAVPLFSYEALLQHALETRATAQEAADKAAEVLAALAGKNSVSQGAIPPEDPIVNDLWIDDSDNRALKRWNGSIWELVQDFDGVAAEILDQIRDNVAGIGETMVELDERLDEAFTVGGDAAAKAQEALTAASAAIKGSVVQYAVGSSETVAPTSGWSTATPTRTPGAFVWMRAVVTYGDDSTATTSPALVTGNAGSPGLPGAPGATGVGVASVTPYYRTTTAAAAAPALPTASPPPAPWATTEPTYVADTALWRTDRVAYTNAAFAYTPVTKVSSYAAAVAAMAAAQAASTAAASAGSDAQAANAAALAAAGLAGSKGEVIYQASAPTGSRATAANLWIRTSDNKPHTYDGSAWVAVESKVATDAAAAAATANTAAAAAQSTANAAASAAATADSKAVGAAAAASNAQGAADAANSAAGAAQTTASAAATAAANAAGLAGGKADVLIQSTAPAAAMRKATTLWIDTTGGLNAPKQWTTGTTWVAVTDKAATDAAAAAAAAQTAAGNAASAAATAQARADAAHTLAGTALANADAAIASANARNALYRSTAAPSGTAARVGDMWWRFANTSYAQVIGTWMWSGTSWVQSQLAHQVISSVDVGALTVVGTATLAQAVIDFLWANVVAAKKITTDMLLVGSGANLIPDADWRGSPLSTTWVGSLPPFSVIADPTGRYLRADATVGTGWREMRQSVLTPVTAGQVIRTRARYRTVGAINGQGIRFSMYAVDHAGARYSAGLPQTTLSASAGWTEVTNTWTVPEGVAAASVFYAISNSATTGRAEFKDAEMKVADAASLIVDGTVLAQHLAAGSVTGGKISGDAIDGKTITGATFRTGPNVGATTSGQGVVFDSNSLRVHRPNGSKSFEADSATGSLRMEGEFIATSPGGKVQLTGVQYPGSAIQLPIDEGQVAFLNLDETLRARLVAYNTNETGMGNVVLEARENWTRSLDRLTLTAAKKDPTDGDPPYPSPAVRSDIIMVSNRWDPLSSSIESGISITTAGVTVDGSTNGQFTAGIRVGDPGDVQIHAAPTSAYGNGDSSQLYLQGKYIYLCQYNQRSATYGPERFSRMRYDTALFRWESRPSYTGAWAVDGGGQPGDIKMWAGTTTPAGWLSCWGQAVSRTTYAALFAVVGTTYGAGDGSTTFNLPNMIGRVPVGPTASYAPMNGLGKMGGEFDVTLTSNQMPVHTHVQNAHQHTHDQSGGGNLGYSGDGSTVAYGATFGNTRLNTGIMTATTTATNRNAGGGASHTNVQPFTTVNFLIKF